jgi:hypothetical protein
MQAVLRGKYGEREDKQRKIYTYKKSEKYISIHEIKKK